MIWWWLLRLFSAPQVVYHSDECLGQVVCDRVCICAPRVISLGEWDPRPAPGEWDSYSYPSPPVWGYYPTEKPAKTENYYSP